LRAIQPFADSKAVVQLVLPQTWVPRINQLAIERGITRSALIRQAIAAAYFGDDPDPTAPTNVSAQHAPQQRERNK
jgi:Ribbon-helix-helix protein, copG family